MQTQAGIKKRPRVANACTRCRQQKIKCNGCSPCSQCSKRSIPCRFEPGNHKILVDASFITRLQQEAYGNAFGPSGSEGQVPISPTHSQNAALPSPDQTNPDPSSGNDVNNGSTCAESPQVDDHVTAPIVDSEEPDNNSESHSPTTHTEDPVLADPDLANPLLPGNSHSYTVNAYGQPEYLGTSSNWSFGHRVLKMVHEKVNGTPLPPTSLLFQGFTYDLAWDGLKDGDPIDCSSLPAADYAMFLINAVKFHCSRLFHVFDENVFMSQFAIFHEQPERQENPPILWMCHYLLILAFGKAFIVRTSKDRSPPGAELFTRAMKLLPGITALYRDPIQSIEILICAALYLQCLDSRSAAFNVIGQALRLATDQGLHTDMQGRIGEAAVVERCRHVWWTVYILDRRMTSLMGTPLSISDEDIGCDLPSISDSPRRSMALAHHVQLSQVTSTILRTVYRKKRKDDKPLLRSMKDALWSIAEGSDEREKVFPLNLDHESTGLCRLSAYLHLFHHQCLLLATRPLLFFFWQKRLEAPVAFRITSEGGARSLLRVCISSAKQTLRILKALQTQGLLDSFLPFDREAAFSAATVISLAIAVDPTLLHGNGNSWMQITYEIFEEMSSRGNSLAGFHIAELKQLTENITKLRTSTHAAHEAGPRTAADTAHTTAATQPIEGAMLMSPGMLNMGPDTGDNFSSSEDGIFNANELENVAEGLDFDQLDYWLSTGDFELMPLSSL